MDTTVVRVWAEPPSNGCARPSTGRTARGRRRVPGTGVGAVRRALEKTHENDFAVASKVYTAIMELIRGLDVRASVALMAVEMAEAELQDARARSSLSWAEGQPDIFRRDE